VRDNEASVIHGIAGTALEALAYLGHLEADQEVAVTDSVGTSNSVADQAKLPNDAR